MSGDGQLAYHLHCDTDDTIRRIEETDVSCIDTALGRVPGHCEDINLKEDEENQKGIPSLEASIRLSNTLATGANEIQTNGHGEVEDALWVRLETDDCTGR